MSKVEQLRALIALAVMLLVYYLEYRDRYPIKAWVYRTFADLAQQLAAQLGHAGMVAEDAYYREVHP